MIKLIIFDLDGTLLDTIDDLADSCNYALSDMGYAVHTPARYKQMVGNGAMMLIKKALPADCDEQIIQLVYEKFRAHYNTNYLNKTKPYQGILQTIAALKEQGIRLCVLSNKPHSFTEKLVSQIFPKQCFDMVYGQREDIPKKPDPTVVLEILEQLGVDRSECLYVGDSDVDMITAKNAAITGIGVTWGFRDEQELRENGAGYMISSPKILLKIVEEFH